MPIFIDIYTLCPRRDTVIVRRFLDSIAPHRHASADDWLVGDLQFPTPELAIDHCCANPQAESSIYWSALEPAHAHVHFLPDGMLVVGVSIDERQAHTEPEWRRRMSVACESDLSYSTVEEAPVDSVAEFARRAAGVE